MHKPEGRCCCGLWRGFEEANFPQNVSMEIVPAIRGLLSCFSEMSPTRYPFNLSDTPETEQRDRPPSFLLPQQTVRHISIFLWYYFSSLPIAISAHPYTHLSTDHDHCSSELESVGRRSLGGDVSSWPIYNPTVSGDMRFPRHGAAAALGDQLDQTFVSPFN